MRDSTIIEELRKNAKRNALLFSQFEFLQCRQDALERVMCVAKWTDRIKFFFNPDAFFKVVDAVQWNLIDARKRKRDELNKPATKIEIVPSSSALESKLTH